MSSFNSGIPSMPRATRQTLAPLDTTLRPTTSPSPSPYADSVSEKTSPQNFSDNRQGNDIFANATIPLSPTTSPSMVYKEQPFDGLTPRRRNGLARLFCCFGREERARRRMRFTEFEQVGEKRHWSEL
ncbi:hypothetical protein P280DRAFT_42059 [Massarina eburnea CBS 473.64]|uniref:Uncharacterized protein n=1 Tax=Massarina eburnea CBS 473.64 TaxID=1395130 RepID=A0A6A6RVN8_9PLEO|nr:hypothetical protein P280DRAFT_42059 [Massarina eburnea CBS 473.64]